MDFGPAMSPPSAKRGLLARLLRRRAASPAASALPVSADAAPSSSSPRMANRPLPPLPLPEVADDGYHHLSDSRRPSTASPPPASSAYQLLSPRSTRSPIYHQLQRQDAVVEATRSGRSSSMPAPPPEDEGDQQRRVSRSASMPDVFAAGQPAIDAFDPPAYFHGNISRERAEELLADQLPGAFLVREKIINHQYAVSVVERPGIVGHHLIRRAVRSDGSPASHFMFKLQHMPSAFCVDHVISTLLREAAAHGWPTLSRPIPQGDLTTSSDS